MATFLKKGFFDAKGYALIGLILVSSVFISLYTVTQLNLNRTQTNLTKSQADLATTREELEETESELDNIDTQIQQLENEIDILEAQLLGILENYDFSGTFYVLSQYNRYHDSNTNFIRSIIPYEDYFHYRLELSHPSHSYSSLDLVAEVVAGYCSPSSVYELASYISSNVDSNTDECILNGLLTYCQDRGDFEPCIHYIDDGTDDFSKYPLETLCEGGGDCEDKSILFASMARALGYHVMIAITYGHSMVAVRMTTPPANSEGWYLNIDDNYYYMCETTGYGFLIGDCPMVYQGAYFGYFPA